ncbi:MAG: peptide MFS transporter [Phycisphaerales bacterium]|nr:MAG: peptide MFS transporter [Phycisphaerales bacterium]
MANAARDDFLVARKGELFGHPTCLFTLFFTEFWERFSFYGMKALLIFYMTYALFWKQAEASHVFAWYAGLVYATPVLGGLVADKLIGARWSVVIGGVIIATGHFLLAFEPLPFFYSGLGCLVIGTGFLKPNISTQVGALYRQSDERRDSAFTIFYMGINSGAFAGPLVCEALRVNYGFHYGFAAAGVGMVIGLIMYIAGMRKVVRRERQILAEEAAEEAASQAYEPEDPGTVPPTTPPAPQPDTGPSRARIYLDRSIVLVVICVFAILFWVGFEQAANAMNLWADQHTNLHVFRGSAPEVTLPSEETHASAAQGWRNWRMGAAMTQSINPLFIITLAAVFAWLWQYLERRGRQPSTPFKMAFGVFFLSCAYGILIMAAQVENGQTSTSLRSLPEGVQIDENGKVYSESTDGAEDGGEVERTYYGATRLTYQDGQLQMRGVLNELDWIRALAATANPTYRQVIAELVEKAETRADEVRGAQRAGELPGDYEWEVSVSIPEKVGDFDPLAGLPTEGQGRERVTIARWDADTRTLTVTSALSDRGQAELLAAGADPEFREALTSIYRESSVLKVSILWLLAFYLVLTIGELCLSPVGLSLVTKAAPPKLVGLFMGLWFFTTGFVANFLAHTVGGYWGTITPAAYFMIFGVIGLVATVIMLSLIRVLKPMLHGVH